MVFTLHAGLIGCGDGDPAPGDSPIPSCGDGIKQEAEQCDDGNTRSEDGCSSDCQFESTTDPIPSCGNGIVEGSEECDEGTGNNDRAKDACRTDCQEAFCGDGVADTGESCDDGNSIDNDFCNDQCQFGPGIVNGIVDANAAIDIQTPACTIIEIANYPIQCYNPSNAAIEPGITVKMEIPDANGQLITEAISMPSEARFAALYNIPPSVAMTASIEFPAGAQSFCLANTEAFTSPSPIALPAPGVVRFSSSFPWGGVDFPRIPPPNGSLITPSDIVNGPVPCHSYALYQLVD